MNEKSISLEEELEEAPSRSAPDGGAYLPQHPQALQDPGDEGDAESDPVA
jgi:hypothetical protein